jgi:hypothetical protein
MDKALDLSITLADAPRNCWVALDPEETKVVGSGKNPEAASADAHAIGVADPVLIWSPENWTPVIGKGLTYPARLPYA